MFSEWVEAASIVSTTVNFPKSFVSASSPAFPLRSYTFDRMAAIFSAFLLKALNTEIYSGFNWSNAGVGRKSQVSGEKDTGSYPKYCPPTFP